MNRLESDEALELALTTEANFDLAENLANTLIESKLAACINLYEIKSIYWWEGQLEESSEIE